jgi:hypothetical protein
MFERIKERMAHIDYGCNLQSSIVFVPILSLVALKVHKFHILNESQKTPYATFDQAGAVLDSQSKKLTNAACCHLVGSLIQVITLIVLRTFLHPLFAIPFLWCSVAELMSSIYQLILLDMNIGIDTNEKNYRIVPYQ